MAIAYTAREDHVSGGGDDRHRRYGKAYKAEGGGGAHVHVVPGLAQNSGSKMKLSSMTILKKIEEIDTCGQTGVQT